MVQEVAVAYHHELLAHRPPAAHPARPGLAVANTSPLPLPPSSVTALANGRWTDAEHRLFLQGLEQYGNKGWKEIATLIQSRTVVQTRTHAQKYFKKLSKARQNGEGVADVDMDTGIAIPVGPYVQPVVTMRTTSVGNHQLNMGLGNDPTSMAAGFATAAAMTAEDGGGRKRRNDGAPGGGTKRRAFGNVNVVSPVTLPTEVFNARDDPYVATTIMCPPLMVAGTAASAIAEKNVFHMAALEDAMFRRMILPTRAPSPALMQQSSHPPSINLPIAHTQYRKAPSAPPQTKAHPQETPRTTSPTGVADKIDMSLLSSWTDNDDGSADIDTLLDDAFDTLLDDAYRMGFPDLDMGDEQAFVDALNSRERFVREEKLL